MINKIRTKVKNFIIERSEWEKKIRFLEDEISKLHNKNEELEKLFLDFSNDHQRIAELYNYIVKQKLTK
jgi:predicted nuclease with TOPRIM domain